METQRLVSALREALEAQGFEAIQTHLSVVLLGPKDVYKFKRPLDLGFVDFTRQSARKQACEAELTLNKRLAEGVYLGLVCVSLDRAGRPRLTDSVPEESGPENCEWGVHMRRLPDSERADYLLEQGKLTAEDMADIASMLASFHARARCDAHTRQFGTQACIAANVEENFRQIAPTASRYLTPAELERITSFQRAFLENEQTLFADRVRLERIRDGHGDLRLEHLYRQPDSHFLAIDCIEFNERFRFADVCSDLAFLVMDLLYHRRADLAERLVLHYAERSRDYGLYRLLDFYVSYRAMVRAKVRSMLAVDGAASAEVRAQADEEVRRYYEIALLSAELPARRPQVIAIAGGIASGKSSLSSALSLERGIPMLSTDRIRKELLGISPTSTRHDSSFQGAYDPAATQRVYAEVFARAEQVLLSGRSVILDASFRSREERAKVLALAKRHEITALFLECRCSRDTALARLDERAKGPSVSDGRREIYDAFMQRFEPLDEILSESVCRIDTDHPIGVSLARARSFIEQAEHNSAPFIT